MINPIIPNFQNSVMIYDFIHLGKIKTRKNNDFYKGSKRTGY